MKNILYIIGFLLPLTLFGQTQKVFVIADSTLAGHWSTLSENWRYQKGDNMAWANPDFDDASWSKFSYYNLNMPDGQHAIANRGEIVWFRKRIKAESSLTKAIVLNIYQFGASEIYLDGKLIHQLGKVSSDFDKVIFNNPYSQILQLPLEKGKEQVLAVRYVNAQYKFPLYTNTNGLIRISISTLSNANSKDVTKNNLIAFNRQIEKNYYIALGIAILIFIIFTSFYLFFPNEKINGYFAISNLLLILFCSGVIWSIGYPGVRFWIALLYDTCIVFFSTIIVYCLYRIVEQPIDFVFKAVTFLGLIAIGSFFLYNPDTVGSSWGLLMYVVVIRIAVKSWNKNRVASILLMSSSLIGLFYWAIIVLTDIGVTQIYIKEYTPFTFMLSPVVLAIYLGYAFGKQSQKLRLNLDRVQKLSKEKESILSLQNETLEKQVQERTASLNRSIEDLKSTQSQLIQSEKMASLGELTAGIAHEIQNPLNFVNNFSEVSNELIDEMNEELEKGDIVEAKDIASDIKQNLNKINHHGQRASSIVKGMLDHSRTSNGIKVMTDINVLADEYLRLSYHGLRAKDRSFNADFKTDLDETIPKVNIVPQDFGRVILNLINNAFYAVSEKKTLLQAQGGNSYEPTVLVSTKKEGNNILISVKDNGNGIPKKITDKIFQPFFTTKPAGSGTGLGLSLSYDIVKAHGGKITVDATENEGTEFRIILPIKNQN